MLEIVNLVVRVGGISCSYTFLGICEVILRGRDLIFFVWNLISVNISRISNNFFNLDNMEPAPGCPAPEKDVKALKIIKLDIFEQASGCLN